MSWLLAVQPTESLMLWYRISALRIPLDGELDVVYCNTPFWQAALEEAHWHDVHHGFVLPPPAVKQLADSLASRSMQLPLVHDHWDPGCALRR